MNDFNLNLMSNTELMVISTILILICYAVGNDILMPNIFEQGWI